MYLKSGAVTLVPMTSLSLLAVIAAITSQAKLLCAPVWNQGWKWSETQKESKPD